jgi:beta-galactosidase
MRPWESPELTGWRRLPAHALLRQGLSLDGPWRFQLLPTPEADLSARWARIDVPSCWTMCEFDDIHEVGDRPQYTNVDMPWPDLPPTPPPANPTGVYEREADVPGEWAERRIVLHVGAAESVVIAQVNGVDVGIGKDSHLASEFDVTHAVRPGRPNTVRLTVVKWSDATFVEDQDQWWHAGSRGRCSSTRPTPFTSLMSRSQHAGTAHCPWRWTRAPRMGSCPRAGRSQRHWTAAH